MCEHWYWTNVFGSETSTSTTHCVYCGQKNPDGGTFPNDPANPILYWKPIFKNDVDADKNK